MSTWFLEIMKNANERMFSDFELERIMLYYNRLPARLRAAESVERVEGELISKLVAELKERFPERTLYTPRFVQDVVESLRHMVLSLLADEPRLFRTRWLNHLTTVVRTLELDPRDVRDVYELMRELLSTRLSAQAEDLLQPYFEEVADALSPARSVRGVSPIWESRT
jgi:hypothetical protein